MIKEESHTFYLIKRLKMDDFTGGSQLDDIIKQQRKQKKNMKGKA